MYHETHLRGCLQSCSAASCGTAQHESWEAPFSAKRNASTSLNTYGHRRARGQLPETWQSNCTCQQITFHAPSVALSPCPLAAGC
jgi:hypothetical protein